MDKDITTKASNKKKGGVILASIGAVVLASSCLTIFAAHYGVNYVEGSTINGEDVSKLNIKEAVDKVTNKLGDVNVVLWDSVNEQEIFSDKFSTLAPNLKEDVNEAISSHAKPQSLLNQKPKDYNVEFKVAVDSEKIKTETIDNDFKEMNEKLQQPVDASFGINDEENQIIIVSQEIGKKFDVDKLGNFISDNSEITYNQSLADGGDFKVYIDESTHLQPQITQEDLENKYSQDLIDKANQLLGDLTININPTSESSDSDTQTDNPTVTVHRINLVKESPQEILDNVASIQAISVENSSESETTDTKSVFTLDDDKADKVIEGIKAQYNTMGSSRKFTNHSGNVINVTSGDYGWWLNYGKTYDNIKDAIVNNKPDCDAVWRQKGEYLVDKSTNPETINDFSTKTYIEVSISEQKVYGYKDGELVYTSDCVTGSSGRDTPKGMFSIAYCQRNATLRGPGYQTPVSYWMPFYDGCGFHDADWNNGRYGSSTYYIRNGSHGCVNLPSAKAKELFGIVEKGWMVVVY